MKEMDSGTNREYGLTGQGADSKLVFRNSTPNFMEEGKDESMNPEELGINPAESQAEREGRRALLDSILEKRGDKPLSEEEMELLDQILSPTPRIEETPENPPQVSSEGGQGGGNPPPTAEGNSDFEDPDPNESRYLRATESLQEVKRDFRKFERFIGTVNGMSPEELKNTFSESQNIKLTFLVGILADDLEGHDEYIKKFRDALRGDISQLHSSFRNIVREISEDAYREYRKREEPEILEGVVVLPDGQIVETNARQRRQREDVDEPGASLEQINQISRTAEQQAANERIADTGLRQMDILADEVGFGGNQGELARRSIVDFFEEQIEKIYDGRSKQQQKSKELSRILQITSPQEMSRKLHDFIKDADNERQKNIREGKEMVPQEIESIQDLARFIIRKQDTALYGREGKYPLLIKDKITGVDRFQPNNFLVWLRDQSTKLHNDNATSEISFLGNVAIETQLRTISIYMMTRFRAQYFKDEISGEVMDDLAEQVLNEAWGFGITRNMDLKYRQVMNSDGELPKAIVALYAGNDLTRSTLFKMFSSMSDRFDNDPIARDTKLGDAFMLAEDIYYNLPDLKELKYVAGEDSPMFNKEWFKKALMMQQGKLEFGITDRGEFKLESPDSTQFYDARTDTFYFTTPQGERKEIFDNNNNIIDNNYYNFINFFLDATPDDTKVAFIRELVRFTAAKEFKIHNGLMTPEEFAINKAKLESLPSRSDVPESQLKDTLTKEKFIAQLKSTRDADRINLVWAENNSYVTLRPLLIAAKNDTGRRGYDAETKLSMLNYLLRQSGEGTAGPIGNPEALGIFRNLSVDALAGLKTESGLSPQDIYRFIRNLERGGVRWVNTHMPDGTTRRELIDFTRIPDGNGKFLSLQEALSNPKYSGATLVSQEEKKALKSEYLGKLKFAQNAMVDYSANQINRAYEIFHSMSGGEQLNLGKIVSYDPWKGIIYDYSAFEELVKDKFIKPMRYAFASNSALNYGSVVRAFVRLKDGQPVFEDMLLVDHMFGADVTDEIKKDTANGKFKIKEIDDNGHIKMKDGQPVERALTYAEYVNTGEGRTRLVKNAARARFAAELRSHRKYGLAGERWNAEMVETMLKALKSLQQYEEGPDGKIREAKGKAFFSKADIAWIRKHSGTQRWKLIGETYGKELGEGLLGIPGLFGAFTKGIVDFA